MEAVDSYEALMSKSGVSGLDVWENAKKKEPSLSDHLKVHKPYIDAIRFSCSKCKTGQTKRVPEVIDCWYDSGAMPFAQWGFPHKNREMFQSQFPADFISEALDQTRGWFYSLVAISTLLFGEKGVGKSKAASYPLPFRNCIVLGLLMGEDGLKMSKSKKNYKEPTYIFEHEGADAMRWLFFSGQTPWTSIRFQESAIAEAQREFLIRLYNCYSFFVIYANIDKWTATTSFARQQGAVSELDRWILSELAQCSVTVFDRLNEYDNYAAAKSLIAFVDALSNWYVRRSRDRFWKSGMDADKNSAYATLHHCLVTVAKLIAPFTPFIAESIYQNLTGGGASAPSVHLCDFPVLDSTRAEVQRNIDGALNEEVELIRQLVSCGRAARSAAKLRVRQPLATVELYHRRADVVKKHEEVVRDELNIKRIEYKDSAAIAEYVTYELKPDFKKIGPKHGPLAPKIKAALAGLKDVSAMVKSLEQTGTCKITVGEHAVELTTDEVLVELHAKEGYSAERIPGQGILVLDTHLTPELIDEGMARDLVNQIQQVRKNLNLKYEQRIDLAIVGDAEIQRVLKSFGEYIMTETLAKSLLTTPLRDTEPVAAEVESHATQLYIHPL
jgi:isoleucyl-tRNA synthetase